MSWRTSQSAAALHFSEPRSPQAQLGDAMAAHGMYERALRINPRDTQSLEGMAWCAEREIGEGAAMAAYRRVVDLQPDRPTVWCELARLNQVGHEHVCFCQYHVR